MANTISAFGFTESSVASGTAVTTPSISWSLNDVVFLFVGTEGSTGGETIPAPTNTGSGISFGTAQQIHQSTGADGGLACWACVASASSSGTFSDAPTHSGGARNKLIGAYAITGSSGIGNSVLYTGASPTGASLTPLGGAGGTMVWVVIDWAAAAVTALSPTPTTHSASSPGPTASPQSALISGVITYYMGDLDSQASTGATSYGITGAGTGPFTIIGIEAKAAAGGTDATVTFPQSILIHP